MNEGKPPGRHPRQTVELDAAAKARIKAEEVGLLVARIKQVRSRIDAKPEHPTPRRRDQVRAWILIVLGVLMFLAGVILAIHKLRIVDLAPVGVGVATVRVGIRYLRREEIG